MKAKIESIKAFIFEKIQNDKRKYCSNTDKWGLILNHDNFKKENTLKIKCSKPCVNFLDDLAFLRGSMVFEVMWAREKIVFHLEEHVDRLFRSMKSLKIKSPYLPNRWKFFEPFLKKAIKDVLNWNKARWTICPDSLVKVFVSSGLTTDGITPFGSSSLFIKTEKFCPHDLDTKGGLKIEPIYYKLPFPGVKTVVNYAKVVGFLSENKDKGWDDVLYLTDTVSEGSRANFFAVFKKDSVIKTPPEGSVISGVTRKLALGRFKNDVKKFGYVFQETPITKEELFYADEMFLSSTTLGFWPVGETRINGTKIVFDMNDSLGAKLYHLFGNYRNEYFERRLKK